MKHKITMLILFIGLSTAAQTKFKKGYFISNDDIKTECFIKSEDWRSNPVEIKYRINEDSKTKKETINSIKEFSIYKVNKFQKFTVNIDRSSDRVGKLSSKRALEYTEETLFLKVLIEGNANLYFHQDGNLFSYFYTTQNKPIRLLEHKRFKTQQGVISENKNYIYQLKKDVSCTNLKTKLVKYTKKSLSNYFLKFNNCDGNGSSIDYLKNQSKKSIAFNLKLGVHQVQFSKGNESFTDNKNIFGVGGELIYTLPFNNNKWAIFIEPTFNSAKIEATYKYSNYGRIETTIGQFDLPIGIKHFIHVNKESKLFLSSAFIFGFSHIDFLGDNESSSDKFLSGDPSISLGLGYYYKNRYSLEARYRFNRVLVGSIQENAKINVNSISIVLGYKIF
mgnify:CR=1 FL=1